MIGATLALLVMAYAPKADAASTHFGLQPFPYDFTHEAIDTVHSLAADHGTLYVVHRDNGIPWAEALRDGTFPAAVRREWDDLRRKAPSGHKVYLALGPLAEDRVSLMGPSEGSSMPRELRGARFDHASVKKAYLNYARRAVRHFRPDYLNLGIEAGELAARAPQSWPQFEALYEHVRSALKDEYPDLAIGISFGLQLMMKDDVAARVKPLVEKSDYLGLSFYPYMSAFFEKFGADPLAAPPEQWRRPLAWARAFTRKPIALCETGYATRNVDLPAFDLHLKGSPALQEDYVDDLAAIAARDRYLFVAWSMPVDYDALYRRLPAGDGRYQLWQSTGLFDPRLEPKPAWARWAAMVGTVARRVPAPAGKPPARPSGEATAGASLDGPPCVSPEALVAEKNGPEGHERSSRWSFSYQKDRWQWCARDLAAGELAGRKGLAFWVRSDRKGPLFVQLEEEDGEAFFAIQPVGDKWQRVALDWPALQPDPKKRKDGRLDPARVVKVLIADAGGALDGARGKRSIWFAGWTFQ